MEIIIENSDNYQNVYQICDSVEKLSAMDMIDKDGTPAIFTKRIVNNNEVVLVGSTESYMAVSRKN